jgi:hypothetical protein
MKHSESIAHLSAALVEAQSDIKAVEKSAVNPHFKSRYVPLDAIVAMARPALARHGLALVQSADQSADGKGLTVESMLVHSSGEWLSNAVYIPLAKQDPQGAGASVTYGRRFGLSALIGITSEEDDDGNAASQPAKRNAVERPARRGEPPRPAQPVAKEGEPRPEDVEYQGKKLSEYSDGELAALALQAKHASKHGWVKAINMVRTNRSLGVSAAPVKSDEEMVARMKQGEEQFQSALPNT